MRSLVNYAAPAAGERSRSGSAVARDRSHLARCPWQGRSNVGLDGVDSNATFKYLGIPYVNSNVASMNLGIPYVDSNARLRT